MKYRKTESKRVKKSLKVLMGTSILASTLMTGHAFASTTNNLIEKNHFGGEATAQVTNPVAPNVLNDFKTQNQKTFVPLVKSVTPAMGTTVVRPDANMVIQLDPTSKEYRMASAMLKNGLVQAYVLDGKTVTVLPKADVTFDATANQAIISHDVMKRYTQHAIVLTAGENDLQNHQDNGDKGKSTLALPMMDVVTAVDDNTKTVTLLNGGVISYTSFDKEVKGLQMQGQQADWQRGDNQGDLEKAKTTFKLSTIFQVGNVVYTKVNPFDNKNHIIMKNPVAISSVFKTGSAIGEATHVTAGVANNSVRVTEGGSLNVNATDDYGNPATNATLTVSGKGTGNARVASTFATPDAIEITKGTASVPLNDHSANIVSLAYQVRDNANQDGVDVQSGITQETFIPGTTAKLHLKNPATVVAGKASNVSGDAEDIYGNIVLDGTAIQVSSQRGSIQNMTATKEGSSTVDYTAPTKKEVIPSPSKQEILPLR
ncbi:hypothetical protein PP175_28680 (plasmid) [Aneurinibacillus sp. Ricciae_BoGa-3]|uniref:hypothetical protein n=1 Tax=Aneurinibacillus sp. Ricciae_BoGa-3 TaxID=3022697 RepID=UPI00233FAA57|nr:hypothetical protein [Aneurinibacillus sp. Ricciae_BoGa-3]WCK57166.1 hypothetical protein PP175_28680 [Aneurinibacillus sp. Ricciae_BoGa-3]